MLKLFVNRFFLPFVSAGVLFFGASASAVTISPVLFDRTMDPGSTVQGSISLINDTSAEQTYYASVQNFSALGEEGQQTFLPETDTSGLVSWIALDQPKLTLKAGETKDFTWAIRLPQNAEPGGHYAAVFFSTLPPEEGGSSVGVGAKTGVLFLVNVTGDIKESVSVDSFKIGSLLDHAGGTFETRVYNDGNVHTNPGGTITITNMFGQEVGKAQMNPLENRVLPKSYRRIRSTWGSRETVGNDFLSKLQSEYREFGIGKYTAKLNMSYGTRNQSVAASTTFWIFPWRLLLVAFGGLVGIVLLFMIYNRMVVKSVMKKMQPKK